MATRSFGKQVVAILTMVRDYASAAVTSPRLFLSAVRHVQRRKTSAIKGMVIASRNHGALTAGVTGGPLSSGQLVADLAKRMGVLLVDQQADRAIVGVAAIDLASAFTFLKARVSGLAITVDPPAGPNEEIPSALALANAAFVRLIFDAPDGQRHQLQIEPYFARDAGQWVSRNTANSIMRAVYSNVFASPGLTTAESLLGAPSLSQHARDRPIDAVYTWVNHLDPTWQAMYSKHRPRQAIGPDSDAAALSRFHNNDELRYSLRSVAAHLPWINRIHVLTNCAPPEWLTLPNDRIAWVQHADIMPARYLPTFNSHVIESYLHHLPGLSEHFLYLNDDMFVARRQDKGRFFFENGASKSFLDPYGMVSGPPSAASPDYLNAARNSAALIRERMGYAPTQLHGHTVYALRRTALEEIERIWHDRLSEMRMNSFRSMNDINIPSFLYHHYANHTGMAAAGTASVAFIKSLDIRWRDRLRHAFTSDHDTVCLNEGGTADPSPDWHGLVRQTLQIAFPDPAEWEKMS